MSPNLTDVSTHYEFGANWKDYSEKIDLDVIQHAESGLLKLISKEGLAGKSFLDIGSGSGLHSLAALRLGAASIIAVDIDPNSVEATRTTLERNWTGKNAEVRLVSVLAPEARDLGQFDVVYSWGGLHHTGAMWEAIEKAASHVKPGGQFILAVYKKTPLCCAWAVEKKIFTKARGLVRSLIRGPYIAALNLVAIGRSPSRFIREYKGLRGMNFYNDVDDWLGGYPYESATEEEIVTFMAKLDFADELVIESTARLAGLFGTGCSEFRFRRADWAA